MRQRDSAEIETDSNGAERRDMNLTPLIIAWERGKNAMRFQSNYQLSWRQPLQRLIPARIIQEAVVRVVARPHHHLRAEYHRHLACENGPQGRAPLAMALRAIKTVLRTVTQAICLWYYRPGSRVAA